MTEGVCIAPSLAEVSMRKGLRPAEHAPDVVLFPLIASRPPVTLRGYWQAVLRSNRLPGNSSEQAAARGSKAQITVAPWRIGPTSLSFNPLQISSPHTEHVLRALIAEKLSIARALEQLPTAPSSQA